MVRGTGKYKQRRGGGRNFSRNMAFDQHGAEGADNAPSERRGDRDATGSDDDEDEEEEVEEEEEDEDEDGEDEDGEKSDLTRAQRKELKKQQAAEKQKADGEEEDPDFINPNHVTKKMTISDLNSPRELTRREREQKAKQEAKDSYWKLHVQGKTQEAQADLSRLAKIRAEREAAQAKRKAEMEAKATEIEAKKQAQLAGKRR
ncbi:hypothetical protein AX17_003021 [Amanita inopinata Kibby_2008]|nr:hypothetical protein AX17_003021 [Amanita inopinata Kibby_2008]